MVRKTRKQKSSPKSHGLTVPELRRAFERVDDFVQKKGADVDGFRKEWKKIFGKDVSKDAAKDYLEFVMNAKAKAKGRAQKGGMAPLQYDLRPGADIPYGSFPEYVSGGFGFANKDSIAAACGESVFPTHPPSGLGSNKPLLGGGGRRHRKTRRGNKQRGGQLPSLSTAVSEFFSRPFLMSSPPTLSQDVQMLAKGYNGFPSPRPEINNLSLTPPPPIYSASANPVSKMV